MSNHLVIGLGGTGGRIIRAFRKKIFERFRTEEPESSVNLRYLFLDTSEDDLMKQGDPSWKVLGRSVQLKKESQLLIKGMSLATVLDDVRSYAGISPWLGDRDQFRSVIGTVGAESIAAAQKRRLGRFLFACKVGEFRDRVQSHVNAMQKGGTAAVTFHVCCGLAGGTGSGSVVDVVSQLRALYPHEACRIFIYAFLPDEYPKPAWAKENYHANGYAALLELNALAAGAWKPHDVFHGGRLDLRSPFNGCYLFSDTNEANQRVDVESDVWEIVANFLFQKIVAATHFNWESLERQEKYENCEEAIEAERSSDKGAPERCRLFFGFGIKQIAYPEEEIREFLTYSLARQASLQLRYSNWSETQGFVDEAVLRSYGERVQLDATRQRWRVTDDHLMLSLGILPDEISNRQWRPISEYWQNLLPNLKSHVRENTTTKKEWNDALKKLSVTAFGENYRTLGVQRFYDTKQRDLADEAREIRRVIEADLFDEWRNGVMSMADIDRLLETLSEDLASRKSGFEGKLERLRDDATRAEGLVASNDREWAKVGPLGEVMGKYDRIFDAQGNHLSDLYTIRTRACAIEHAKRLMALVESEVQMLRNDVAECGGVLTDCAKEFDERMKRRCADDGAADLGTVSVRFYKPHVVKDFERRIRLDESLQRRQTAAVRQRLTDLVGEERRFGLFARKLVPGVLLEEMEKVCEASALHAHEEVAARDRATGRILGVSIIDQLHREYAGNPEGLRAFAEKAVSNAKTFLPTDDSEVNRKSAGIPKTDKTKVTHFTVLLPNASGNEEFARHLGEELTSATGLGDVASVMVNPQSQNEITLVCVRNVMPARYAKAVSMLRRKYDARVAQVAGTPRAMELHSEGDGSLFPSLFPRTVTADDVRPYVLLAQAMGFIRELPNPRTEVRNVCLVTTSDDGMVHAEELGPSMDDVFRNAGQELLDGLQRTLTRALSSDYLAQSKRDQLSAQMKESADAILAGSGGNPLSAEYRTYTDAAARARAILSRRA